MNGKSLPRAIAVAAAVFSLSASVAFAGEVTGSNVQENQNQGVSWCSFSGLNDDPTAPVDGPNGPGGKSQNYGQDIAKWGLSPPSPGVACNPIRTFLPPNPNRTK